MFKSWFSLCGLIPSLLSDSSTGTCVHTHTQSHTQVLSSNAWRNALRVCMRTCVCGRRSQRYTYRHPTYHLARQGCRRKYKDEELTSRCGTDPGRDRTSISSGTSSTSVSSSVSVSPGSWLRVLRAPAPIWYPTVSRRTGGVFQAQDSC